MSQENVEMVRRGVEAFNRRDFRTLAELTHTIWSLSPCLRPWTEEGARIAGRNGG
jgi:hypothetical protein